MRMSTQKLLYILEQPFSWSTSRIGPSCPRSRLRLSTFLASPFEHASCCHVQPGILLFISVGRVSHLTPSCYLGGFSLMYVQVNNITTLHNICALMYIHHIGITILFSFLHFHSSWQAGWPQPFPSDTISLNSHRCEHVHPELTDVVLLIIMQITQMFSQFLTLINIYAKLLIKEKYQN